MKLPHRFPFRLVERAIDGRGVVCASADAWWGRSGNGPGLPLLVEAVAQAAALVLAPEGPDGSAGSAGATAERMSLAAIEDARLTRAPRPGERVEIDLRLETRLGHLVRVRGELRSAGEELGAATVVLAAGRPERSV